VRVLVRSPNWIGDQVMARGALRALRAFFAADELVLLAPPPVREVELGVHFEGFLPVGAPLRGESFDVAVGFPASVSSALAFWRAGIPKRIAFAEPLAKPFLTRAVPWRGRAAGVHKSALYDRLAELVTGRPVPPVSPPARSARRVDTLVVAPAASLPLREWPRHPELWRELRRRFPRYRIQIVGGSADEAWKPAIARAADPGIEDWIGRTSVAEVTRLCGEAAVVVAADSGVAHLSATLAGTPTVVLFGPGDPAYVIPTGPAVAVRVGDLACSPCESARCRAPFGYQRCLRDLDVAAVVAAVERAL